MTTRASIFLKSKFESQSNAGCLFAFVLDPCGSGGMIAEALYPLSSFPMSLPSFTAGSAVYFADALSSPQPPWNHFLLAPISSLTATGLLLLFFLVCLIRLASKSAQLRRGAIANRKILRSFQLSAHPLAILQHNERHPQAPLDEVYQAGTREMAFHLTGSSEVHSDFSIRLRTAAKVPPTQLRSVNAAMRCAMIVTQDRLEAGLVGLATALRTVPWLACLAPLCGWLEHEWTPSPTSLKGAELMAALFAPVAIALVGTVICQCWWQSVASHLRSLVHGMECFAIEVENLLDRWFVDHSRALEKLPSIDAFAASEGPSFSLPPTEATLPAVLND